MTYSFFAYHDGQNDRRIRMNKGSWTPEEYIVFDTEALRQPVQWGERQVFRLGAVGRYVAWPGPGATPERYYLIVNDTYRLWQCIDELARAGKRTYVFAHNLGYDLQLSDGLRQLTALGYEIDALYEKNGRVIVRCHRGSKKLVLVDSLWLLPASIEDIGRSLGLEKLPMPSDDADIAEWATYCHRDVDVLANAIAHYFSFLREHDLGRFRPTISGQALTAYRHAFMRHKIYAPRDESILELELASYRGGRTECFVLGRFEGETFYKVDVNSMYPYVMARGSYPTRCLGVMTRPGPDELARVAGKYFIIADAYLATREPIYGVRKGRELVFPIGRFRATICGDEVRIAVRRGHIVGVEKAVVYQQASIFNDYVEYFWKLRKKYKQEGNKLYEYITKLFLNGLYGKFGQHGYEQEVWAEDAEEGYELMSVVDAATGETYNVWHIGHKLLAIRKKGVGYYAFPAIAAGVTAAARVYLWQLIEKAGLENVYYCDTDSLIVNSQGMYRLGDLVDDMELGKLKVEGVVSSIEIRGPKDYRFGDEEKVKGLGNVVGIAGDGTPIVSRWQRLRGALREGVLGLVKITLHPYVRRKVYSKGEARGGRVYPIELKEF